jgi:eukaryotic-like serine/threonine-protein kinase
MGAAAAPALDRTVTRGSATTRGASFPYVAAADETLHAHSVLGNRYEILQLIGKGGMGAVYKAHDCELDRVVALKVIRPELARDFEILHRFKQELILARQVTHRNVIRIYDFAEADGIKFITMDFVEGQNLNSVLNAKGKFSPREAGTIIEQICEALEAAHAEGVIHRDLKPQNIMLDSHGKAVVMDFGIARNIEVGGVTEPGALLGTPEYMSPEQAMGEKLDARSDLFSLGIIFYELLTGRSPYKADTAMASLYKRTKEHVLPPHELVADIPMPLSEIVVRCLAIDKTKRYGSAGEVVQDLQQWLGPPPGTHLIAAKKRPSIGTIGWVGIGAIVVVAASVFLFRERLLASKPVTHKEVSLLVADFANNTAESVFDETLEPAFVIGLEGSPFIESFSRGKARKLAAQLRPGATTVDEPTARLVATREGIDVIVAGSIGKEGNQYAIQVKAIDGITGKTIDDKSSKVSKKDVLSAVGKLAAGVRSVLGDTTPESRKLSAQETFTADSLEAAHEYAEAQNLLWDGKWEESLPHFDQAMKLDPRMGRAYAGFAVASFNLGRHADAQKHFREAMAHMDRMTDREKYRTRASYYIIKGEPQKAIEEYTELLKQYPYDDAAHSNLAIAHFYLREMDKAVEVGRRDVEINPRGLMQRTNLALYEMYNGDFANAAKEAREVLQHDPKSVSALGALAMGQLGQGKVEEAIATYEKMQPISVRGASSSATGLADVALYEGRLKDAKEILEGGITSDQINKNAEANAIKLSYLASLYLMKGENQRAAEAAKKAVSLSREPSILYGAGSVEAALGHSSNVATLASELSAQLSPDAQAYGKLLQAETELKGGDGKGALNSIHEAQQKADSWLVHFDLGRAYLAMGAFVEASSEFDVCRKRRGEAAAVFLDDVPSYHVYPPVLYYQGVAQEGLKSAAASDYFKQFLDIKAKGSGDLMIADARRHIGLN